VQRKLPFNLAVIHSIQGNTSAVRGRFRYDVHCRKQITPIHGMPGLQNAQ
jgi:hypothetical protein